VEGEGGDRRGWERRERRTRGKKGVHEGKDEKSMLDKQQSSHI